MTPEQARSTLVTLAGAFAISATDHMSILEWADLPDEVLDQGRLSIGGGCFAFRLDKLARAVWDALDEGSRAMVRVSQDIHPALVRQLQGEEVSL